MRAATAETALRAAALRGAVAVMRAATIARVRAGDGVAAAAVAAVAAAAAAAAVRAVFRRELY